MAFRYPTEKWKAFLKVQTVLLALIPFIVPACSRSSDAGITFNIVPPLGQQSNYEIKANAEFETISKDSSHEKEPLAVTARLETNVTDIKPDGTWTLAVNTTTLSFEGEGLTYDADTEETHLETSFSVTMDNRGRFLDIPENSEFAAAPRDILLYRNPSMVLPSMMLPAQPVNVGASWPIDVSVPLDQQHFKITLILKGKGTLSRKEGDQAYIDLDFSFELDMPGTDTGAQKYIGKGTSSAAYDLKSSRFISNKLDMTRETVGFAVSDNDRDIKTTLVDSLQADLIGK